MIIWTCHVFLKFDAIVQKTTNLGQTELPEVELPTSLCQIFGFEQTQIGVF